MFSRVNSICIVRLSAIGDVCHAVAMVRRIQRAARPVNITWIIGQVEAQLVGDLPGVNFIIYDKKTGLAGMRKIWAQLKGYEFDALFMMQVALRANILSVGIKAKRKIGFDKARSKELHQWFCNESIAPQSSPHVLDGFMGFADAIHAPDVELDWRIPVSIKQKVWAASHIDDDQFAVVICPAASKVQRNWTVDGYARLAEYLSARGATVYLCGGPSSTEAILAEKIIAQCRDKLINLVGETSLKELTAIIGRAKLVVAPDSGPAHIATTQGVAVLGLYAHSNPRRTGPYFYQDLTASVYDDVALLQHKREVKALHWGKRNKGDDLMEKITVKHVLMQLEKVLHRAGLSLPNSD